MNSVENAIRAALNKGDAGDQVFRRRVYGSASAALERSLAARVHTEPEIAARRKNLLSTIRTIESEYLQGPKVDNLAETKSIIDNVRQHATDNLTAEPVIQPVISLADAAERTNARNNKPKKWATPKKNRPWFKYALNGALLALLIMGGFWAYGAGKRIYADATEPRPSVQKPVLAENADLDKPQTIEWIQIFNARDADLLSASLGAKAEIISRDGNNYVVMSGDGSNEVSIKIGAGLMQNFAGKRVLFNFKARSANDATLDTGAHCAFGDNTKCERKRFKIGPQTTEYMFAVTVAASARGDGALLIAPDLTGSGGSVEIENIRATIVEPDAG